MRNIEVLIQEVVERNKLRADVGLPLVSVAGEVAKLEEVERAKDYREWYNKTYPPELQSRAAQEVLALERKERGIPNWRPTLLNGGPEFSERLRKRVLELKEEEQSETNG